MYKDKPFPYPLSLTQLEGFDPTVAEIKVAASPAVQLLRQHGLPKYGTTATAMTHDCERKHKPNRSEFELTEARMTPTEADRYCEEWNDHLRKASFLASQVRREILGNGSPDKSDLRLLHDLCVWLNYEPFEQFRWEEHWNTLEERIENAGWYRQVAKFQISGNSDLIVLLASTLSDHVRQGVRNQIADSVAMIKNIQGDHTSYFARYLPQTKPVWIPGRSESGRNQVIAVIDCGDIIEVKSRILNRQLQRQITAVRFELPRTCFVGSLYWSVMSAPLLIFDVEALDDSSRETVFDKLSVWLVDRKADPSLRKEKGTDQTWQATEILRPANDAQLCAVIVAGPASRHFSWEAFSTDGGDKFEWVKNLFEQGMATIRSEVADD